MSDPEIVVTAADRQAVCDAHGVPHADYNWVATGERGLVSWNRKARDIARARVLAAKEEVTNGDLDNGQGAPVPPGVVDSATVPPMGPADAAQAAGAGEAGALAEAVVKLGNCPACGSDKVRLCPSLVKYGGWVGFVECRHDGCEVVGPSSDPDGAKWNRLCEAAAKAEAFDAAIKAAEDVGPATPTNAFSLVVFLRQVLAKKRAKGGLT